MSEPCPPPLGQRGTSGTRGRCRSSEVLQAEVKPAAAAASLGARQKGLAAENVLRAACDLPRGARCPCLEPLLYLLPSHFLPYGNDDVATAPWEKRTRGANKRTDSSGSLRALESIVFAPSVLEAAACSF